MRLFACLGLAAAVALSATSPAFADDDAIAQGVFNKENWPLETIHRPLTLASGMLSIEGDTLWVNLSSDAAGDPVLIRPDIYFGINGQLTAGITHTGRFPLLSPGGFCVSGDVCDANGTYDSVGAEVIYALTRGGNVGLAAHGGILLPSLSDPFVSGLTAGLTTRFKGGKLAFVFDPTLYLGVVKRDPLEGGLKEQFTLPVDIQYQLNTQTMVYVASGINGPLDGFGDAYMIPAGIGANFAINNRADLGAEFEVFNVAGKEFEGGPDRFDGRAFVLRFAIRI